METKEIVPIEVSQVAVASAKRNIAILGEMVKEVLEPMVDYGGVPGLPGQMLFDPGAAKIMAGFNCYAKHEILKERDDGEVLSYIVESHLVSRISGDVVASGIGAASTMESKYKYRWVDRPEEWGYIGEAVKALKTRKGKYRDEYRIPNPERGELQNTLLKMAAKRAEVDAVLSLPGVGSALRHLFSGDKTTAPPKAQTHTSPRPPAKGPSENGNGEDAKYRKFWGETNRMGLKPEEVHQRLGVASMKDWEAQGKTLEEAITFLREQDIDTIYGSERRAEVEAPDVPLAVEASAPLAEAEITGASLPESLKPWNLKIETDSQSVMATGTNPLDDGDRVVSPALRETILEAARKRGMTQQEMDKLKAGLFPDRQKGIAIASLTGPEGRKLLWAVEGWGRDAK